MAKITDYTIVISQFAGATEKRAAALLREKIKVICGKKVPLVTDDADPVPQEIVVGKTNREELDGLDFQRAEQKIWEFVLKTAGERLYITGLGVDPGPLPYTSPYVVYNDGQIINDRIEVRISYLTALIFIDGKHEISYYPQSFHQVRLFLLNHLKLDNLVNLPKLFHLLL